MQPANCELYRLFARLLVYPTPGMAELASQVMARLQSDSPQAAELLRGFLQYVEQVPQEKLEEVYTYTFDLQGVCYLYIGYHLFGETYKRSWFMARLNREYSLWGFTPGNELPDHIAVVLDFLALGNQYEFSQTLLVEGLIPALEKMAYQFKQVSDNPYGLVIQSILLVLREQANPHRKQIPST